MKNNYFDRIPSVFKNKYLVAGVIFLVVMLFFNPITLVTQYKMRKELNGLKKELQFYRDETQKDSIELSRLLGDSLELEKLGREKYMMKRDSEDIYIIVRKPAVQK